MAAIRHLELDPGDAGAPRRSRHLELVPAAQRPTPAAVHRRRRLVVGVMVAVVLVAALRASAPDTRGSSTDRPPAAVHVVQPGDTYWSIASSLDRSRPLPETVDALVAVNGDQLLQPGDHLSLPR